MAIDLGVSRSCLRLVPMLHIVHGSLYFQFLFLLFFCVVFILCEGGETEGRGYVAGI